MTRTEAEAAFPIGTRVSINGTRRVATVTGYDTFDVAFIGRRTWIVASQDAHPAANSCGQYVPEQLTKINDKGEEIA